MIPTHRLALFDAILLTSPLSIPEAKELLAEVRELTTRRLDDGMTMLDLRLERNAHKSRAER